MGELAVIPARCGSKGVPDKNIRDVAGKPLLAWSIEHASQAQTVSRTIVATDSEQYAQIARDYGAEVPFLRPAEISGDDATDLEVFQFVLEWLLEKEGSVPDICVHLRPTSPYRNPAEIDAMVESLRNDASLDSVRTVKEADHTPYKMWTQGEDGLLTPILTLDETPESWNMPRQALPAAYLQTANIDVVRSATILEKNSMTGDRILGRLETTLTDIDTEHDLRNAAQRLRLSRLAESPGPEHTICFDIDGVIATITTGNDYHQAKPIEPTAALIRRLYALGFRIVLHTARGSMTGIDWESVTREQMKKWDVPFHSLTFGKPAADVYIDDRFSDLEVLMQLFDGEE